MRKLTAICAGLPICAILAIAQDSGYPNNTTTNPTTNNNTNAAEQTEGAGKTLVGILVDSSCSMANIPASESSWLKSGSVDRQDQSAAAQAKANNGVYDSSVYQSGSSQGTSNRASSSATSTLNQGNRQDTTTRQGAAANGPENRESTAHTTSARDNTSTTRRTETSSNASSDVHSTAAGHDRARDVNRTAGADSMADRTETSAMTHTTPEAASTTNNQTQGAADRAMNTGNERTSATDNHWDKSCFISPSSHSFVLMTQDGRKLRLDEASDQMVVNRLQSTDRVQNMNKIFRVRVKGTVDGDAIHINDIQI
jgi:hypothetical protein